MLLQQGRDEAMKTEDGYTITHNGDNLCRRTNKTDAIKAVSERVKMIEDYALRGKISTKKALALSRRIGKLEGKLGFFR